MLILIIRLAAFALGAAIVIATLTSAIKTLVLPRGEPDRLSRIVFVTIRRLFELRLRRARSYAEHDRIMAFYAPLGLLSLVPAWLILVLAGYMAMYWAIGVPTLAEAFQLSGSSVLTLGSTATDDPLTGALVFSEAAIGLILIALLIAYLPAMYAAFSRREALVTLLEVRAGNPPSAMEMIKRFHRLHGLERLGEQWRTWEVWFADVQESHTSLPALVFFRSSRPEQSWVTAAGAVLDAASLTRSSLDIPVDVQADLCIRAGYLALRRIADFFGMDYDPDPAPDDPIHVGRHDFDAVYDELLAYGVPMKPDRDQAWRDFAGWRVNYDRVLIAIAALTTAPHALWSSDRRADD